MILIVKRAVTKTIIAKIVAMIGENPLVIEKMKMWDPCMNTTLTMMWTTMMEI